MVKKVLTHAHGTVTRLYIFNSWHGFGTNGAVINPYPEGGHFAGQATGISPESFDQGPPFRAQIN